MGSSYLYNIKSELEDIYFRYAEPEQYRAITNKLKSTERDRQKLMTQFIEPLKQKLSDEGIKSVEHEYVDVSDLI